ncbi:MAG: 8-oxoguanine DNA glycosylase [Clostridia bacterium]|nr:8-oxoguanine DNA glycosylase [Clostridia bacterium]
MNGKEQIYKLNIKESFLLSHIFECGQCFRWQKREDESYTGVFQNNVLNVKQENEMITFKGICDKPIKEVVDDYFDMQTDYKDIKNKLSQIDNYLAQSIEYGSGIRILNQDLWEVIISFIISANNNIPRIQKIIERLSKEYGNKIIYNEEEYFTFPTKEQLSKASIEDLRRLGLGFRDKYVYETTKKIIQKEVDLESLKRIEDTNKIREILLTLPGIGPKVADCIMLFGMHKFEVFPIDVWVRRVMNELYIKNKDETKVNKKEIEKLAKEKYANLAGIAQQYLFYWKRETA